MSGAFEPVRNATSRYSDLVPAGRITTGYTEVHGEAGSLVGVHLGDTGNAIKEDVS